MNVLTISSYLLIICNMKILSIKKSIAYKYNELKYKFKKVQIPNSEN